MKTETSFQCIITVHGYTEQKVNISPVFSTDNFFRNTYAFMEDALLKTSI